MDATTNVRDYTSQGWRPAGCDRVALVLPNGPEMAVAFLAVSACATCAPLNPAYRQQEFEFYLEDLKPRALLIQDGIESPVLPKVGFNAYCAAVAPSVR